MAIMKKSLLFSILALLLSSCSSDEPATLLDSGNCGENLTWTLFDNGVLTISGTGSMYDYSWFSSSPVPWDSHKNIISSVIIKKGVTRIGNFAFYSCDAITSISMPNSVTDIGDFAFAGCACLTTIKIPSSVTSVGEYAFSACSGLISVDIPNSVTKIGSWAFSYSRGLIFIAIPNSVISIGSYAFYDVPNIVYNGSNREAPWGARSINGYVEDYLVYSDESKINLLACSAAATGEIVIPNSVTSIGNRAFYLCSGLTSITIPNSVISIGSYAFAGCGGLTMITSQAIRPPYCYEDVFEGVDKSIPLYVPEGSVENYKSFDAWKEFCNIIALK